MFQSSDFPNLNHVDIENRLDISKSGWCSVVAVNFQHAHVLHLSGITETK